MELLQVYHKLLISIKLGSSDCIICMQNYEKGENIVILPCSNLHHFHSSCIRSWFGINSICPLCRNNLNDL